MKFVSMHAKVALPARYSVTAEVGIGLNGQGKFGPAANLRISLPGLERETAQVLVHKAHEVCPYSNATRGNVDVNVALT